MLDPIHLLRQAVSIPSVTGAEAEVGAFLVSQLQGFCDEAFLDAAGNAVGVLGSGPLKVYCLGHIDTVPGAIPVRLEDGKLYGRGAVDAKGPFCAAIAAASALPEGVREALTLYLIGAVEEESPSSKGARYAMTTYLKPDLLIIGEPSGWDAMTLGYKGRLVVKLSLEKPNFHSAGDDTTAAEEVVAAWQAVRAWAEGRSGAGIFERVQAALQSISSTSDGLTQRAEAVIGLRLPPSCRTADAEAGVKGVLGGSGLEVAFLGREQPYRGPKDTPLTRAFRVAIRAQGGTPRFKLKTGTSDMNVVAPFWDVPMLAYGAGDSALDHTPDEHVEVAELARAVAVLREVFVNLAATANRTAKTP